MSKLRHSTRGNREAQQTQRARLIHHVDISSPVEKSTSVVASIFQKSSRLPIPSLPIGEKKKKKTKEKENRGGKEKRTEKKSAFHSSEISDRVERARRKIISQTSHRFPVPHWRRYARNEESRKGEPPYFRQIFTPTILSTCTRSQRPEPPTPLPRYFSIARNNAGRPRPHPRRFYRKISRCTWFHVRRIIHVDRSLIACSIDPSDLLSFQRNARRTDAARYPVPMAGNAWLPEATRLYVSAPSDTPATYARPGSICR